MGVSVLNNIVSHFIGKSKRKIYTTGQKSIPNMLVTCLKSNLDMVSMDGVQKVDLVIGGYHG